MRSQQITITRSAHCAVWEHRHGGLNEAGEYLYDRKAVRVAVNLRTHTGTRRGVVVLTNQMKVYPNPVGWTLIQGMPFTRQNTVYAVRQQIGVGVWLKKIGPAGDLHIIKMFPDSPAGEAGLAAQ